MVLKPKKPVHWYYWEPGSIDKIVFVFCLAGSTAWKVVLIGQSGDHSLLVPCVYFTANCLSKISVAIVGRLFKYQHHCKFCRNRIRQWMGNIFTKVAGKKIYNFVIGTDNGAHQPQALVKNLELIG